MLYVVEVANVCVNDDVSTRAQELKHGHLLLHPQDPSQLDLLVSES